jgi:hypothetical protein
MDKATATQLANIEKRTSKSLDELTAIVKSCGFQKHGEIRDYLKRELGLGHGDANTLVHVALQPDGASSAAAGALDQEGVLSQIYSGPKAALRPIHAALMARLETFGPFEVAPKKGYVSLRRAKQFAMVGPATNTKVEVGINLKGVTLPARFVAVPPGGMCQFKVRLEGPADANTEVIEILRQAYDAAG